MFKITMKYTDYNGNERNEDLYFNLTEAELMKLNFTLKGGIEETIKRIMSEYDTEGFYNLFEKLILTAYGVKSEDGRTFEKSSEISTKFSQTEAYSQLVMGFINNPDSFNEFVRKLAPKKAQNNVISMPT